jgi:hypothetical protein
VPETEQRGRERMKKTKQFYTVRVLSPEEVAQQETDYTNLLQTWQPASTSEVEKILATRELVEPEPELRPEIVAKLKQKMALRQIP